MAITSGDLLYKFSVRSGSAGHSVVGTAAGSLGKWISTTTLTNAMLGNLFDDVSGDENAASDVEYRCVFFHNAHPTLTARGPLLWISAEVAGGTNCAIAVDTTAASAIGSATPQALEIVDENTAPVGLTFTAPTTKGTGLPLGDIPAGFCRPFWVRRSATNSAAILDGLSLRVECDTEP